MRVQDLETPCLLLDRAVVEKNIARMAGFLEGKPASLRPHFKTHKCTRIAKAQLAAGNCVGITCAIVGEAEVLVDHGVADILIANQVVGTDKLRRLAMLQKRASVMACVDDAQQIEMLGRMAREAGVEIGLLCELDTGLARCGVSGSGELLQLARRIEDTEGVVFRGLQGYEGHACFITDKAERERVAGAAIGKLVGARGDLEKAGVKVDIVSAGGTGTYDIAGLREGIDELQAGSYVLMDARYRTVMTDFDNGLFLLSSVVSAQSDRAVFDVGYKSAGAELEPPVVSTMQGAPAGHKLNEEHLCLDGVRGRFRVGDKVRMIPWHGCTTCNLYDRFHVIEGDEVVGEWRIEASGLRN